MTFIAEEKLRRTALARQGLLQAQPFGRGINATQRAIQHLGYVQIDTISVVTRAHNHVLRSRVPNYDPQHLHRLLEGRKIFEARFPIAAFRPMEDYRFTLLHARTRRAKPQSREQKLVMRRVLDRIRSEGPLRTRDFEDRPEKSTGWWDWKPAKRALEQLFHQGDLMITARDGFEKTYDLTERVLPSWVDTTEPSVDEFARYLVDTTVRAHGFASYKSMGFGGRFGVPIGPALRAELRRRSAAGELTEIKGATGVAMWAEPNLLQQATPRAPKRAKILSPFDNAVTQRERMLQVFGFDYQIECFVPEAERRFGYFCLPILYGDRLVGRVDCKAHRESGRFEVKALYLEGEFAEPGQAAMTFEPLAQAISEFACFDDCGNEIVVSRSNPTFARKQLQEALTRHAATG